ncbi:hypothetical protein C4K07_0184 [Pseudomonas chlororaphis subsp. aureofaciens]|uniref:Uncharacterized protein n=1 Tax=Pseudomonas chlororaphis subsp. aureofaciens TaxID=587851 RepID=A0AAD0ZJZ5_9PSED|nr:hypothetical protein C4K07_0184 [Pseudomonas chlororaphis subsp. aureofaciens]
MPSKKAPELKKTGFFSFTSGCGSSSISGNIAQARRFVAQL